MTFDPRTMGKPVYQALATLIANTSDKEKKRTKKSGCRTIYISFYLGHDAPKS